MTTETWIYIGLVVVLLVFWVVLIASNLKDGK